MRRVDEFDITPNGERSSKCPETYAEMLVWKGEAQRLRALLDRAEGCVKGYRDLIQSDYEVRSGIVESMAGEHAKAVAVLRDIAASRETQK